MTDLEYQLLHFMATHRNQTFSVEELFVSVWNELISHLQIIPSWCISEMSERR